MRSVLLASGSPRRRAFLEGADVPHVVHAVDLDERQRPGEAADVYALRLAAEKADAAWAARPAGAPDVVLAADTVVVLDGRVLGKPADADDAARTLGLLSGRTHEVITAWALLVGGRRVEHTLGRARVTFEALTAADISAYVSTGDPLDKAGAYGVQGPAGRFIERVEGDYAAVVGLPIEAVLAGLVRHQVLPDAGPLDRQARSVRGRIAAAASGNGRPAASVTLVAVSKRQPLARVAAGVAAGLTDLGENYVQAWRERVDQLPASVRWHLIGHLQRNKARFVDERVALVHGVAAVSTAQALGKVGRASGRAVPLLVQVNVGQEASKAGVLAADLASVLDDMAAIDGVRVDGLMTIPPVATQAGARRWFAMLRSLRDGLAQPALPLTALSMGMSGDYEAAIAEGATLVRVGTAVFGDRDS